MMYRTTLTAPVFGLRREIDRLFENTIGRGQAGRNEWSPAVDIYETNQELTFAVELPGIKLEDVEVTAVEGILTIQGERIVEQKEGEEGRYHLVERNYGSFMRRFQLPQDVDNEKIEAEVEHGMLKVRIPKASLPQPKKIQIKSGATVGARAQQAIDHGESREGTAEVKVARGKPAGATVASR
jgi:HSP20 family protein